MKNYIEIDKLFSFGRKHFMYVDTEEYLADVLFVLDEIPVRFKKGHFKHPEYKYVLVFCSVSKKYEERFKNVMDKLANKMLLSGRTDYNDFCDKLWESMERGASVLS